MDTQQPHILLVTTGTAGDLFPFLRLGTALQASGHQVTLVAPALHEAMVRQSGLAFHGTVADPAALADPNLWHPTRGFGVVWRAVRPGLAELTPLVLALPPDQPLTIVAHPLALPEADLCRALQRDVRIAAVYLAPSNIPTVHDPLLIGPIRIARWVPHAVRRWLWRQIGARLIDPVVLPDLNAQRRAQGLAPIASLLRFMHEAPDLSLTLFPAWFGHRQPDWPQPLVCGDFTLYDPDPHAAFSPELRAFLDGGSAPLVFTHGTGNIQSQAFFAAALQVLATLGRRAIFLCSERTLLPAALPATVLWQAYLPFSALLPHAAALVHHGGIGTTAEALRAGVPQLIVPLAFDQFDNGARIAAMHAGLVLHHRRLSATTLASSLHRLTSCTVIAHACQAIRTRMQADSALAPVVAALSDLANKARKN